VEPELAHTARNLTIAACGAAALQLAERPVVGRLTALVVRRRWGLLQQWELPPWLEVPVAMILMDYTLYLWHVLCHRAPLLWRAHAVHHVDRDLDASTALRFHFAELIASVPWRAGQVVLIGVSPKALSAWQNWLMLSILFHHSNLALPRSVERAVGRLFVTPRMHGIHHSIEHDEVNANWSSGLTLWDWLHGTLKLDVEDSITIGVRSFGDPEQVRLPDMLALPFTDTPIRD
jgi:sterol desaturase/sphingolipid hydroxylase (fatty acid hydroxylase superfamily)